jgi:hypothetical protein
MDGGVHTVPSTGKCEIENEMSSVPRSRSRITCNLKQSVQVWNGDADHGGGSWGASVEMEREEEEQR